jgi:hypothetical protein
MEGRSPEYLETEITGDQYDAIGLLFFQFHFPCQELRPGKRELIIDGGKT